MLEEEKELRECLRERKGETERESEREREGGRERKCVCVLEGKR